jgi:hypothetical protein
MSSTMRPVLPCAALLSIVAMFWPSKDYHGDRIRGGVCGSLPAHAVYVCSVMAFSAACRH